MTTDHGRDIWCTDSLRTGRTVTGTRLVAQAVYRRFITERGALRGGEDEANYGLDLTQLVGQRGGRAPAESIKGRIRNEARKDPRVLDADVTVVRSVSGAAESWEITIQGRTATGPFELVLAVDEVTTKLVGLDA